MLGNRSIPLKCTGLAAALLCLSCAGSPLSPAEMAHRRVAATSSKWSDGVQGLLRFNPARCQCPQFEILVDGAWNRIEVTNDIGEDPLMADLYAAAMSGGAGWTATVTGRTHGVEKQRYRFPVVRVEIVSVCPGGLCPGSVDTDDRQADTPGAGDRQYQKR